METQIITYLLKASLSFVVFYLLYLLCFRNDTLLNIRRFYFLAIILFSISFPFINIQLNQEQYSALPEFLLPAAIVTANTTGESSFYGNVFDFSLLQIVLGVIFFISSILLLRFIVQVFSLIRLKKGLKQKSDDKCQYIYLVEKSSSSFSFFNWIFLNHPEGDIENDEVIAHEKEHAKQLHSIDVVLIELTCIVFWWNPIVWMIRSEMKTNLEYLADRGVVNNGYDSYKYQYTLLQTINNNTGIPFINNFNVSQLKKRIAMMNKQKTSIFESAKYLLSLPLIAGLLLINCSLSGALQDNSNSTQLNLNEEVNQESLLVYSDSNQNDRPFTTVEIMPRYPGGDDEMFKFIGENLKYPESAEKANIQGRVIIRFVVDKEGNVIEPKVLRGVDPACDAESLRVISMMPKWTPGKQNGKEVAVYFTIPIIFKIPEPKREIQE